MSAQGASCFRYAVLVLTHMAMLLKLSLLLLHQNLLCSCRPVSVPALCVEFFIVLLGSLHTMVTHSTVDTIGRFW